MAVPYQRLIDHHKLDPKSLERAFTIDTGYIKREKVKKLADRIRDCIRAGIDRNRRDYRLFKALDWARDTSFYQISFTQLRHLLSSKPDDKKVMETINSWGLAHLLPDEIGLDGQPCCDPASGKPKKMINLPVFTNIFVPLVVAYVTIRWAKLFNERDLSPLFKYEPVQYTKENRARCEILTQVVQRQSTQFDYKADLRQHILQMLHYGFCIEFPREAWFAEKQEDGAGKEKIVREGLRFNLPHPSRVYYDLYHRLSTLNSNNGCEYAGYWELCRYGDIESSPLYWNKDKISYGSVSWFDVGKSDFIEEVFPCTMSFPDLTKIGGIGGSGPLDRQSEIGSTFYNNNDRDAATLLTQHFQRLVPAEHDLGTYKYPVWFRFVTASDNAVIWAEPLAFDKLPTSAYDADFNKGRFNSLGLDVIPFQDHISNVLTQWIMAVKENLKNPVFYDRDKVTEESVRELRNYGNKTYGGRVYIPFSSTQNYRMNERQPEAFFTPQLTHHNTAELQTLLIGILDVLERMLQFSSQELGQPATHEQTAEETRVIARYTANRVQLTGSFVDDAVYAKKCVIYDATMAHADKEITVGISSSFAATEEEFNKLMKTLGFTIQDETTYDPNDPDAMRTVKGDKSALQLEAFASTRDANNRIDNLAVADSMSKMFLAIAQNPVLLQSIGTVQLVELINQIAVALGLPKEFRLKGKAIDVSAPAEQQGAQVTDLLTKFSEQVKQAMDSKQEETLQAAGQQTAQIVQQALGQAGQQTSEALSTVGEAVAQQAQTNQVQDQQMQQLAAAVAALNQRIEQAEAAAAAALGAQQPPTEVPIGMS
jgi:hypothetical protein